MQAVDEEAGAGGGGGDGDASLHSGAIASLLRAVRVGDGTKRAENEARSEELARRDWKREKKRIERKERTRNNTDKTFECVIDGFCCCYFIVFDRLSLSLRQIHRARLGSLAD